MTPNELKAARQQLGFKSQSAFARALGLQGNGDRTIRRWEKGQIPIPGPVQLAIQLMLEKHEQEASQ